MKNLLQFLARHHVFFLFLFLETVAFAMVVTYNIRQKAIFDMAASSFSGTVNETVASVKHYFSLKRQNDLLQAENAGLRTVLSMKAEVCKQNLYGLAARVGQFEAEPAHVIRNSIFWQHNFFTIDKGHIDGIKENMAVVAPQGVAGIVFHVSSHFATVISLLNTKLQLSAMIKHSRFSGTLMWDGRDYRYIRLVNIPNHINVRRNDTVVTSGYSSIFPKGVGIGTVEKTERDENSNFMSLTIRLFVDFSRLETVYILKNNYLEEQKQLEKQLPQKDG